MICSRAIEPVLVLLTSGKNAWTSPFGNAYNKYVYIYRGKVHKYRQQRHSAPNGKWLARQMDEFV